MATRTLNVLLTGDAKGMQRSFASATSAAGKAKIGIAAAAVGAGLALKELYDVGAEFDEAFDTIRVGTGKTGKALDGLKDDFKNVVSSVPTDFEPAAEAIADLNTRLGLSGKPLRKLSTQFLELSRMTDSDVAGDIKSVTRAFGDWEVATGQQSAKLDFLFRASQESGASVSELAEEVVKFGAPLRQVGFSFDEATAMFASFEKAGVNTATMMPGLKQAMGEFFEEGIDPKKGILETFKGIEDGSLKTSDAIKIFGKRAGGDMVEAVEQGRFHLDSFTRKIAGGKDTIRKAGEETQDASEKFQILGNKLKVLVEPAATAVFGAVGNLADWLSRLNFQKLARGLGTSRAELREFGQNVAVIFEAVAPVVKDALQHAVQFLKHFAGVVRGVVKVVASILKGDLGGAWDGAKQIFRSGVKATLHLLGAITAPIRAIGGKIKGAFGDVFGGAWGKVKDIFRDGANEAIDLLNKMIGVINKVPFIDIGEIGRIGGGSGERSSTGSPRNQALRKQSGGIIPGTGPGDKFLTAVPEGTFILNREATAAAELNRQRGGMVPVALEAGERMFTPGEVQRIGLGNLQQINSEVPRFAVGGIVGDLLSKGAGAVLGKLPDPSDFLPSWMDGSFFVKAAAEWVKEKFANRREKFGSLVGGVPGFTGPPPSFKQLGDNAWVDSHTLSVGHFLAKKFGREITDGWRPQNASYGAKFSSHKRGSPSNPGALDFGPPSTAMRSWAGRHIAGLTENTIHDWGSGLHNHIAFFQKGGIVGSWSKLVGSHWDNDELATLAHFAGMPNPGRMAQKGQGESGGNAKAVGDGGKSIGLWQIHTGYNPQFDRAKLFNPIYNARAAASILESQGIGAWYAPFRGPRGKVLPELMAAFQGRSPGGRSTGGGGRGAKPAKPEMGIGQAVPGPAGLEGNAIAGQVGVPRVLQGLRGSITSLFKTPGMNQAQRLSAAETALQLAEGTPGADDDLAVLQFQRGANQARKQRAQKEIARLNRELQKPGLHPKSRKHKLKQLNQWRSVLGEAQTGIGSANEGIASLGEPGEGAEDPHLAAMEAQTEAINKAREAEEEHTRMIEAQKEEMKALKEEMKLNRRIAESELGTAVAVAKRALADILAGQIGPAALHGASTAGDGTIGSTGRM